MLGICVGMQILFAKGIEHSVETDGCEQWPGVVERLQPEHGEPVPHMGWNTVDVPAGTTLFDGIEKERFYFVHSYGVRSWQLNDARDSVAPAVTWTSYGGDRFVAAVENGPLTATQFHPEKSGDAGCRTPLQLGPLAVVPRALRRPLLRRVLVRSLPPALVRGLLRRAAW